MQTGSSSALAGTATPVGLNGYVASVKTQMAASNGIIGTGIIGAGNETDMNPVTDELSTQTGIASQQLAMLSVIASKLSGSSGSGNDDIDVKSSPTLNRKLNTNLPRGAMAYSTSAQQTSGAAGNPTSYGL